MNAAEGWQWAAGLSALGFYAFLAVWVGAVIWSRTKERLAIQQTLQTLIQRGDQLSRETVEALQRAKPQRTAAEVELRIKKFRYWGLFLLGLGTVLAVVGLRYADSPVKDLREMTSASVVLFVIPGLFCLAHSLITAWTSAASRN